MCHLCTERVHGLAVSRALAVASQAASATTAIQVALSAAIATASQAVSAAAQMLLRLVASILTRLAQTAGIRFGQLPAPRITFRGATSPINCRLQLAAPPIACDLRAVSSPIECRLQFVTSPIACDLRTATSPIGVRFMGATEQ